jgi:hypothetical protein
MTRCAGIVGAAGASHFVRTSGAAWDANFSPIFFASDACDFLRCLVGVDDVERVIRTDYRLLVGVKLVPSGGCLAVVKANSGRERCFVSVAVFL